MPEISRFTGSTPPFLHTTEVTPLPDYRLFLRFNNGASGAIDLSDELTGEVFAPLRNPALFATVMQHPIMKTVVWSNGADLAPEFLLELMARQKWCKNRHDLFCCAYPDGKTPGALNPVGAAS